MARVEPESSGCRRDRIASLGAAWTNSAWGADVVTCGICGSRNGGPVLVVVVPTRITVSPLAVNPCLSPRDIVGERFVVRVNVAVDNRNCGPLGRFALVLGHLGIHAVDAPGQNLLLTGIPAPLVDGVIVGLHPAVFLNVADVWVLFEGLQGLVREASGNSNADLPKVEGAVHLARSLNAHAHLTDRQADNVPIRRGWPGLRVGLSRFGVGLRSSLRFGA